METVITTPGQMCYLCCRTAGRMFDTVLASLIYLIFSQYFLTEFFTRRNHL